MALSATTLVGGLELDDLFHALHTGEPGFLGSAFTFFGEGPRPAHVGAEDLPWWTEPGMRLDLFRPLAAVTHWLDHAAWPGVAWVMHLHSLLWYGLLVAAVHRAYLALGGEPRRAALAALVFGLSQAHAMNVGWVAARNSLVGASFVAVAIVAHARWRGQRWRPGGVLGPLAFAAALLANEGAVAGVGYLVAYALVLDVRPRRILSLVPYLAIVVAWRAGYGAAGHGAAHTGIYLEPLAEPIVYIGRTLVHATAMLGARLGVAGLDGLGAVPGGYVIACGFGLPFVAAVVWVLRGRLREDRPLAAWAFGMVLACATAGSSVPTDRGLLLLGMGGGIVIAELVLGGRRPGAAPGARWLGRALSIVHLGLSPLLLPARVLTTPMLQARIDEIGAAFPDDAGVEARAVVLLNAPTDLVMFYSRAQAQLEGRRFPGRVSHLYAGNGTLTVTRVGPQVLELAGDRPWLAAPLDRMFRATVVFSIGERFHAPCTTTEILEIDRARLPRRVRVHVHAERPGCAPIYMAWRDRAPEPIELPELGASMRLAPVSLP